MRTPIAAAMLFLAACASTQPADGPLQSPPPPAQPQAADTRLDDVQTTLTELLERIDVLNDRIARLEEERVEDRRSRLSPPPAAPVAEAGQAAPQGQAGSPVLHQQPQGALAAAKIADDYRKAIMLFGRGNYGDARKAFQMVYDSEPAGDLADNALFWIGETYFAARDYNNAMRFYGRVTSDYADQNKAPDALYKTALALEKTGDLALARKTLQQVIDRYPYSTFASSAKQELQRIRY